MPTEVVYLTNNSSKEELILSIDILNSLGQVISHQVQAFKQSSVISLDIRSFMPGTYLVRVVTNKGVYNNSFIKQ